MTKRMRNSETPPGLLLLTLLAQCCQVCLKENSVNSLAEVSAALCCRIEMEDERDEMRMDISMHFYS